MAFSSVKLKHPEYEIVKDAPVGFSWTVFFFGFFPALFRGDWKWGLIILFSALVTFGISNLVFIFIYNKLYIKSLLEQGYTSIDSEDILKPIEARMGMSIPRKKA